MKHFFTTKVRVVLVVAVLLAAALAIATNLTGMTVGELLVQEVLTPLRTGISRLTDQAEQIYGYIFEYEALAAKNELLEQELAQMENAAHRADSLQRENERLRKLLELKAQHEDYELVDAYIIAWDSVDWTSGCTVNRGSKSGIEVGMCAITESGAVVGIVTEVGPSYSVIKTILDSTLQINGTLSTSGYSGIVNGSYMEGEENMLRMEYIHTAAVIMNNDQVVTAGSIVFPRNLLLGKVVDAGFNDTGVAKYAILEPAADISSLEQVFILTGFEGG